MAPALLFSVHPGDDRSLYRQISEQVKGAIAAGKLLPGDRLPTHRDLARELVVAPLTVKKAYDTLEAEGLIEQAQGRGTFVAEKPRAAAAGAARRELEERARLLVRQARVLGLGEEDLQDLVARVWRRPKGEVRHAGTPR